jgi:hypothetical protein
MKCLLCSIAVLLLLIGSAPSVQSRITQQKPEDEVLVQGNPPLTLGRVDKFAEFFEWALDSKLTKSQRTLFTTRLVEMWERRDQASEALINARKHYDGLANVTREERNKARGEVQTILLEAFSDDPVGSLGELLFSAYTSAHPGATTVPRKQAANPAVMPARVPAELVGEWIARRGSGSSYYNPNTGQSSAPNATIDSYKIFADGTYEHSMLMQSSLYNCTTTIVGRETGPINVQGSTFIITPRPGTLDYKSSCSPSLNSLKQTTFDPQTYSWRIQRNEYGLELCMQRSDGSSGCYQKQ